MNKRKTLCTAAVAALCFVPSLPAQAGTLHTFYTYMAVSYCMGDQGVWDRAQQKHYLFTYLPQQGLSRNLVANYIRSFDHRDAASVRRKINAMNGCSSIVSRVTERPNGQSMPASVLSDTPFRF